MKIYKICMELRKGCPVTNSLKHSMWHLRQWPVVSAWKILIFLTPKLYVDRYILCDISGTQSSSRAQFYVKVQSAMQLLSKSSPKLNRRVARYIRYIANASVEHDAMYYSSGRMLLLGNGFVNRSTPGALLQEIVGASTMGYLRDIGVNIPRHSSRIENLKKRLNEKWGC